MILSKEEILTKIKDLAGEDITDELIEFIENVDESIDVRDGFTQTDIDAAVDAARKEVEKVWRARYIDRFLGKIPEDEIENEEPEENKKSYEDITFDDIIKEEE